jgi:predicted TIM-barrel fold metal-dependent hydrolase
MFDDTRSRRTPVPDRRFGLDIFDADNHMYENRDALTQFLPAEHKGAIDYVERDGRTKIRVRGEITEYIPNPTFEVVGSPGAQEDYFKAGAPQGLSRREIMKPMRALPGFFDPAPRLELMDELGIDQSFMFPTLASLVEERFADDPELTHVIIHALNRWMSEHWTFDYEGRIFAVPIITLPIVERAIEELEYVAGLGARAILIRPAPVPGFEGRRSFALPEFDQFWDRVVDLDLLVCLHASDDGYSRYLNEWEGSRQEAQAFAAMSNFRAAALGHRGIQDAIISLVGHGCLTRHPQLKVMTVENGSEWVRPLVHHLEVAWSRTRDSWPEHPVEVFRRNVWVHPFHEEDPKGLIELLGADRVCFGSDYPHVEGLSDPVGWIDEIADLPMDQIEMVMGGNARGLIGVGAAV